MQFSYDINVTKEQGLFTTTLPQDVVEKLKSANISFKRNRLGKNGYFEANTLDGLKIQIGELVEEYFSCELISKKLVILYQFKFRCHYIKNEDGTIGINSYSGKEGWLWLEGNKEHSDYSNFPFGINIYAEIKIKRIFKYKSGNEKIEYDRYNDDPKYKKMVNNNDGMNRLSSFVRLSSSSYGEIKEVDCTEANATFFADALFSICRIYDNVKDMLEPENIVILAKNNYKLLGS